MTLSFFPCPTYSLLLTACSSRWSVFPSNGYFQDRVPRQSGSPPASSPLAEPDHILSKSLHLVGRRLTCADVTVSSTSPRYAPISTSNFSHTPCSTPRRLFSASVCRKFRTVSAPGPVLDPAPVCLSSSATILDLSAGVRVGALRIAGSLVSRRKTLDRAARARAVGSSVWVLDAAVY